MKRAYRDWLIFKLGQYNAAMSDCLSIMAIAPKDTFIYAWEELHLEILQMKAAIVLALLGEGDKP